VHAERRVLRGPGPCLGPANRTGIAISTLNLAEDQIDAVLCAYIAMFFTYRHDQTTIFGNFPENGYIVTPSLPPGLTADCPTSSTGKATSSEGPVGP
jgi:predicted RNase H-like nuclease